MAALKSVGVVPSLVTEKDEATPKAIFHFPGGLKDFLQASIGKTHLVTAEPFSGKSEKTSGHGALEWAVTWHGDDGVYQFLLQHSAHGWRHA